MPRFCDGTPRSIALFPAFLLCLRSQIKKRPLLPGKSGLMDLNRYQVSSFIGEFQGPFLISTTPSKQKKAASSAPADEYGLLSSFLIPVAKHPASPRKELNSFQ
jgi:hypothetical protein